MKYGIAITLMLALAIPSSIQTAEAGRAERAFKGKILILKRRPPMRFKSQSAFVRFLRKNRINCLYCSEITVVPKSFIKKLFHCVFLW